MKLDEEVWLALWAATGPQPEASRHWEELRSRMQFDEVSTETQRLIPAIFSNLRDDPAVTDRDRLRGAFKYTWSKNTRMLHDLHPVMRDLRASGIDFRVIKGMAIQARIGRVGSRAMGDVDLLTSGREADRLTSVMEEHGFRRTGVAQCSGHEDATHFQALTFNKGQTHVDVHVAEAKYPSALLRSMLATPPTWLVTAGGQIPVPSVEHLVLHAGAHGRLGAGPSDFIQAVLDVSLLAPFADRTRILSVGQRTGSLDDLLGIDRLQGELGIPNLGLRAGPVRRARAGLARSRRRLWGAIVGSSRVLTLVEDRRRPAAALARIRRGLNGHGFAYAMWLRTGQFSVFERMAVRRWGGFLTAPARRVDGDATVQPFLIDDAAISASNAARDALDWRFRITLATGIDQVLVSFESPALERLDAAVYANGVPITRFAVGDLSNRQVNLSASEGALEISVRPSWRVCAHCYAGLDDLQITLTPVHP